MKTKFLLIILIIFLVNIHVCLGATYYISTTGNDATGDGSITSPFLTLGAAIWGAKQVAQGSEIVMLDGSYSESVTALNSIYTNLNYIIRANNTGQVLITCPLCSTNVLYIGGTGGNGATITGINITSPAPTVTCIALTGTNYQAYIYIIQQLETVLIL